MYLSWNVLNWIEMYLNWNVFEMNWSVFDPIENEDYLLRNVPQQSKSQTILLLPHMFGEGDGADFREDCW